MQKLLIAVIINFGKDPDFSKIKIFLPVNYQNFIIGASSYKKIL